MVSTFLSSLAGKMLIGSVALATSTGGLAATGNLPDPAQEWAADSLGQVGIEVPRPDDAGAGDEKEADERSEAVLDVIEGTDPSERDQEFGEDVADVASDGTSSEMRELAEDLSQSEGDVADDPIPDVVDEVVPDTTEVPGPDVADDYTSDAIDETISDTTEVSVPEQSEEESAATDVPPEGAEESAQPADEADQRRP